jgi:uncharacterized cupredoxin-like copper-binding protein
MTPILPVLLLVAAAALATPVAHAHGDAPHARTTPVVRQQTDWGIAGAASAVRRTVVIRMDDDMSFAPDHIEVRQGETVRLVLHNDGVMKHEFVLGTAPELAAHAELMRKFPDMEHDEPYMAHVPPGERGEIVWHFNRAGEFQFACLISDHYQRGMVGTLRVVPAVLRQDR